MFHQVQENDSYVIMLKLNIVSVKNKTMTSQIVRITTVNVIMVFKMRPAAIRP